MNHILESGHTFVPMYKIREIKHSERKAVTQSASENTEIYK